jgi:hypothetical protein
MSHGNLCVRLAPALLPLAPLLVDCTNAQPGSTHREDVGITSSPVVPGASNISQDSTPDSKFESETAAVAMGSQHLVAYNSHDNGHTDQNGNFCQYYSHIAVSYLSNGTSWRSLRIPTPFYAGVSMLNPDPAVAVVDGGANWIVWVSSLATSTAIWDLSVQIAGKSCFNAKETNNIARDRACLSSVVVPKDGSPAFPYLAQCFGSGTDRLDGGAVHVTSAGNVYAAYFNAFRQRIDVFKNFAAIPTPFPFPIVGHAIFVPHGGGPQSVAGDVPTLIAPDASGNFWVARLSDALGTFTWFTTQITSDHAFAWGKNVVLGNNVSISDGRYSADMYSFNGLDYIYFFYPKNNVPEGPQRLQGARCNFFGMFGVCSSPSNWITDPGANALFPAVAVATVAMLPTPDFRPEMSYWSDNGSADGTLTLNFGRIFTGSQAFTISSTGSSQTPCPRKDDGYWGDYDAMTVHNNGTLLPILVRYFTDSTAETTCSDDGLPQHVSAFLRLP